MKLSFEWDPAKAESNRAKHGVLFTEAQTVFDDPLLVFLDDQHSSQEERYRAVGRSIRDRLLVVVYTERGDSIRIISARQATRHEMKMYEG